MTAPIHLTEAQARDFLIKASGLARPVESIAAALRRHGYIQLDPLNVCGRMHDLILRNRVLGYQEGGLTDYLHGSDRPGFEQYLPGAGVLVAFERVAWPYLLSSMRWKSKRTGYHGALSKPERKMADLILGEIESRGPLMTDDLDHHGRGRTAWGTPGRAAKGVLEKLFAHGEVLISKRRDFRRVYDLPGRVLPPGTLAQPEPTKAETERWLVLMKLRQRRMVVLKRTELPWVEDCVQPLRIGKALTCYCLNEDLPLLEQSCLSSDRSGPLRLLLAPLDPIIYDRKLTKALWGFSYTWEVYTPEAKRIRGYYALPLLSGMDLVGHVEPRVDRKAGKMEVLSRQIKRGHSAVEVLRELSAFLGVKRT